MICKCGRKLRVKQNGRRKEPECEQRQYYPCICGRHIITTERLYAVLREGTMGDAGD